MSKAKKVLPYGEQIHTGDSDSILASMYRALLFNGDIKAHSFDMMLIRYIQRIYREASNIKDRTSLKASLFKELMADRLTWRVFIKGLRVLNISRFEITLRVHAFGKIVETNKIFDLQEEIPGKDDEDDD